jgi:choline transporter-like protein 2/4/5
MIFDLFMFLWTTEFIQAIGMMVVGGTISHWYFATTDGSVKPTKEHHGQSHPCCCAWYIALRFHMGSAAFGSFIIAVVNLIRAAFEYVDHQMKQHGGDSRAMKCLRCMIGCCLACLAKCIRFISKNSYIHTSIKGDAFCFAAVRSYRLIFKHLLSFGATNMITEILMVVGKIMVCCASMLFSYSWIQYTPKFSEKTSPDYLSSTLFISIIVLTLAYLVAESFFNVFNVAIDTILMSYCMDLDSPPVGVASRAIVEENMQKLGKSKTEGNVTVADKPGWFSANENKKDGFIARCC